IATRWTRGVRTNETAAAARRAVRSQGTIWPVAPMNVTPGRCPAGPRLGGRRSPAQAGDREPSGDRSRAPRERGLRGRIVVPVDRVGDDRADLAHLVGPHPARRDRWGPDADPGRGVGGLRVERNLVLVDGDPDLVEERLGILAGDL